MHEVADRDPVLRVALSAPGCDLVIREYPVLKMRATVSKPRTLAPKAKVFSSGTMTLRTARGS